MEEGLGPVSSAAPTKVMTSNVDREEGSEPEQSEREMRQRLAHRTLNVGLWAVAMFMGLFVVALHVPLRPWESLSKLVLPWIICTLWTGGGEVLIWTFLRRGGLVDPEKLMAQFGTDRKSTFFTSLAGAFIVFFIFFVVVAVYSLRLPRDEDILFGSLLPILPLTLLSVRYLLLRRYRTVLASDMKREVIATIENQEPSKSDSAMELKHALGSQDIKQPSPPVIVSAQERAEGGLDEPRTERISIAELARPDHVEEPKPKREPVEEPSKKDREIRRSLSGSSEQQSLLPPKEEVPNMNTQTAGPSATGYRKMMKAANPGLILILIDQSGSMQDYGKAALAATAVNRTIYEIQLACADGPRIKNRCVLGVIGYGGGKVSRLVGGWMSDVVSKALRVQEIAKKVSDGAGGLVDTVFRLPIWVEERAEGGTPMAEALREAGELVRSWMPNIQNSFPPVVINITDGEPDGFDRHAGQAPKTEQAARELTQIVTNDGRLLLLNAHISGSQSPVEVVLPSKPNELYDPYARFLFSISSVLPEPMMREAEQVGLSPEPGGRGFVFNASADSLVKLLQFGSSGAR